MATATILQLPQAVSLTGGEQIESIQNGASVRLTVAQILAIFSVQPLRRSVQRSHHRRP